MTLEQYLSGKRWIKSKIISGQCVPSTDVTYSDLIILVTLRDNTINLLTENPLNVNKVLREAHTATDNVFKLIYLQDRDLYLIVDVDYVVDNCKEREQEVHEEVRNEEDKINQLIVLMKEIFNLSDEDIMKLFKQK